MAQNCPIPRNSPSWIPAFFPGKRGEIHRFTVSHVSYEPSPRLKVGQLEQSAELGMLEGSEELTACGGKRGGIRKASRHHREEAAENRPDSRDRGHGVNIEVAWDRVLAKSRSFP